MASPSFETLKKYAKPARAISATMQLPKYAASTSKPAILTRSVGRTDGNDCGATPKIHFRIAWKKTDKPTVTMIIEISGSPISGLSTTI